MTFLQQIRDGIIAFSDFICGYPLFVLLIGGGLFLFIYSKALPIRWLSLALHSLRVKKQGEGQISSFQALMSTISSTVGLGNIAGVAIALVVGGPGAIFWMWVSALLGMSTKFFEGTLAIMYKGKDDRGEVQGGPMYVITKGLGERMKPLAVVFSVAGMVGSFALMQANQLTEAMATVCISPLLGIADSTTMRFIIGVCICAIVSVVVLGGLKRIAHVATKIVPIMVGCYFLMVLYIIVTNLDLLPSTFAAIINGAFNLQAGIGGIVGTICAVKEETIVIETGADRVRVEFAKWAVSSRGKQSSQDASSAQTGTEEKQGEKKGLFGRKKGESGEKKDQ